MIDTQQLVDRLGLVENPQGGWFAPVHAVHEDGFPDRPVTTVILYLLGPECPASGYHRMSADSVHFFHHGGPMRVGSIGPDGIWRGHVLGSDLAAGQQLQVVVPGGSWKVLALTAPHSSYSLISEAVAPGWVPGDQEDASAAALAAAYPELARLIEGFGGRNGHRRSCPAQPPPVGSSLAADLGLTPLDEGGYFRQTYESAQTVLTSVGPRPCLNTIYYLLDRRRAVGWLHRNRSSITHFHHVGGPAQYLLVSPDGERREVLLGPDADAGQVLTFVAPGGWWKTSSLPEGVDHCLISEAVSPGFRFDDHEMATVDAVATELADHAVLVEELRPWIRP